MGESIHIVAKYNQHDGTLVTDKGSSVALGHEKDTVAPYELLLGGLSYCLFRTFESIAEKMQLAYSGMDMDVDGVKRDDKIGMLETVTIKVDAKGVKDEGKFKKAFEISTRYCSVFNTLSKIAEMKWDINFQ
jgi:putative redox protein